MCDSFSELRMKIIVLQCETSISHVCDHQGEIDVQDRVQGMLSLTACLAEKYNGALLGNYGKCLPWSLCLFWRHNLQSINK